MTGRVMCMYSRNNDGVRAIRWSLITAAALIIAAVAFYRLKVNEQTADRTAGEIEAIWDAAQLSKIDYIIWYGEKYRLKSNLFTVLFMGIDKSVESVGTENRYRDNGQADFLMLAVIDKDAETVSRMMIDRDTMTDIETVGVFGESTGSRVDHISLSHSYGDGREQSCQFTVNAVSRLLTIVGPAKIDAYVALNLSGVPSLNDMVGGVTLTVEEDLSDID
ncbi:MAG: LCP family protein, partial [Oscillospiraceae bacterium]|nr:LCP family protein [Oscillospiraceae bacterium]